MSLSFPSSQPHAFARTSSEMQNETYAKSECYKEQINYLQEQRIRDELRHKQEKEGLRKFYATIPFAQSRTGRMVRCAMGTTNTAKEIMEELN